ncbi:MAG TPA: hypothetical protein VFZ63_20350 [Jiangellaceae bacterium]|jgi:hypothetical protein
MYRFQTAKSRRALIALALPVIAAASLVPASMAAADATCSGTLDIANHGEHIVADYITGLGRENVEWSPSGGLVGEALAGTGAAVPGAPGPGSHFVHGFAPGASFCLDQSQSPGAHPGP